MGKVADSVVGTVLKRGLSGGEKRRTSVGQELVVRQALAFLDEPTSGLDGTAAYDVIKVSKFCFIIICVYDTGGNVEAPAADYS